MAVRLSTLFLVVLLCAPADGAAQTELAPAPSLPALDDTPDPRNWHLELTGGFFREAWDLNASREHLLGVAVGAMRSLSEAWSVIVETHLLHVNQAPRRALLPAATMVFRWRPYRRPATSLFVEGGGGLSYASDEVPGDGTQFNFVSQTGVGLTRALNTRVDLVGGLRWLHLSNNGLVSRARNPDIQAVGLYLGWQLR